MNIKFFKFSNQVILYLFNFFFFQTLIFAVVSPNLIVGDNQITGAGTTLFTTFFLLLLVALIVAIVVYGKVRHFFWLIFIKHARLTSFTLLGVAFVWQLIFVLNVHPPIGFDAGAIHFALTNTQDIETRVYYSMYYNNMALLLIQHELATLFGTTSWLLFDLITMLLVDLSALMNLVSVAVVNPKKINTAVYIHVIWLAIFPTIIIPYTDAWVLPLISCYIMCYVVLRYSHFKFGFKLIAAALFGISAAAAYFIKPSGIVPLVAIVLMEVVYLIRNYRVKWHPIRLQRTDEAPHTRQVGHLAAKFLVPLVAGGMLVFGYFQGSQIVNNQTYMIVNHARGVPAIHFISMGMSGDGGYNPKDALMMAELPTDAARSEYSVQKLKQRLSQKGAWGYIKFLFHKHYNDSADGTFAWDKEGHFINENPRPSQQGFAGHLRQFVYLYGTHLGDFRFISQFWWVIWLGMIAFGWCNRQPMVQTMRLAIIGGFMYLLLFEGGRSRYLIQFLPAFLILATLVANDSLAFFKRAFAAGFKKKKVT